MRRMYLLWALLTAEQAANLRTIFHRDLQDGAMGEIANSEIPLYVRMPHALWWIW